MYNNMSKSKESSIFDVDKMQLIVATMTKDYKKAKDIANNILKIEPNNPILQNYLSVLEKEMKKSVVSTSYSNSESDSEEEEEDSIDNSESDENDEKSNSKMNDQIFVNNNNNNDDNNSKNNNIKKIDFKDYEEKKFSNKSKDFPLIYLNEMKSNINDIKMNKKNEFKISPSGKIIRVLPIKFHRNK